MTEKKCKICGSSNLTIFVHTAKCHNCGILLYFPYPKDDKQLVAEGKGKKWLKKDVLNFYSESYYYNHNNLTNMLLFAMDKTFTKRKLNILDYGGGGGQFASVCKSIFPKSTIYITDISDESLLDEWKPFNIQIPFKDFQHNQKKFDFIFLNDVLEHVSNPQFVLKQLSGKLKGDGKIFIDTPKQFWIHTATKIFSKTLYSKLLKGTVGMSHLQIWSKKSFEFVLNESNLEINKYKEINEFTMPANFYLKNMAIKNPMITFLGKIFYANARRLTKNKIICVCSPKRHTVGRNNFCIHK